MMAELNARKKKAIKWLLYILLLFTAFIFQTTVDLFAVFGVKPMLILPVILFVAMFEGERAGAIVGVLGGLFWDVAADKLMGFHAIILLFLTVTVALMSLYLIRVNLWNSILVVLAGGLIICLLDYLFSYLIWGYDHSYLLLLKKILPMVGYTVIVSAPIFWLMKQIHQRFTAV